MKVYSCMAIGTAAYTINAKTAVCCLCVPVIQLTNQQLVFTIITAFNLKQNHVCSSALTAD